MYEELVGWLRSWSELPAHCECYESCEECNKQDICATFTNESIIAKAGEAADAIEELATFKEQITDGHFYCMRDGVLYEAKVDPPKGKVFHLPQIEFQEPPKEES